MLAVIASTIDHLRHSYNPRNSVLMKSPAGHWPVPVTPRARTEEGLAVHRFGTSLHYANAPGLLDDVTALAGHGAPLRWMAFDCAAIRDTDYTAAAVLTRVVASQEYLVHDADSSQQAAISRALAGAHVLIDGPPGTGKSQTIANIIAGMAALGQRVLFVAEKRAAIEAVTDRLTEADLAHLVFDLHDKRINRRRVAQQLAESLDRAGSEPPLNVGGLHADPAPRSAHPAPRRAAPDP